MSPEQTAFDHMISPGDDGFHPKYGHLVYAEIEQHYGSWLLCFPMMPDAPGPMLISDDDAQHIFEGQYDDGFAYIVDDYIDAAESQAAGSVWAAAVYGLTKTLTRHHISGGTAR